VLVTPIAPHTLAIRPFILPADAVIRMQPEDGAGEVLVTVDGQVGTSLGSDHQLEIRRAERPVRIARLEGFTFFGRLRAKMGWGGPA
jgi:NAD+ kinase